MDCGRGKRRFWESGYQRPTAEEVDANLERHWEADPVSYLKLNRACLRFPLEHSLIYGGDLRRQGGVGQ